MPCPLPSCLTNSSVQNKIHSFKSSIQDLSICPQTAFLTLCPQRPSMLCSRLFSVPHSQQNPHIWSLHSPPPWSLTLFQFQMHLFLMSLWRTVTSSIVFVSVRRLHPELPWPSEHLLCEGINTEFVFKIEQDDQVWGIWRKILHYSCWPQVHVSEAQWGQTKGNIGVWSRERFIAGPSKENGWLMLKNPRLLNGFGGISFIGKIWDEGCRVCDLPLIGWWWNNRMVFQESQSSAFWLQPSAVSVCSY